MFRVLILCLIVCLMPGTSWAQSGATLSGLTESETPPHDAFDQTLKSLVAGDDLVGLAYAIVRDGEVEKIETLGIKQMGYAEAIGPDTRFRIASLSKGFSGTLAASLVQEAKLDLRQPLSAFRPDFKLKTAPASAIKIEHILTHRLGLPPNAYDNLLEDGVSVPTIERRLASVKPICTPGTCYSYQNVTFDLIVDVIEQIEGRAFHTVMQQRVFDPLGMQDSSFGASALQADANWARPHRRRRGETWRTVAVKPNYYRLPAAAGINASITDMAQWLRAQMGEAPSVLNSATLTELHKARTSTLSETRRKKRRMPALSQSSYGLGWRIYTYAGETVITHSGAVAGYAASIAFLPKQKTGIVLLSNANSRTFHNIVPLFLDLELGRQTSPS